MRLLVTGAWKFRPEDLAELETRGHSVAVLPMETDPLPVPYEEIEGVIGNGLFLSHPIEKFIRLRFIQLTSAGLDRVPIDYVKAHAIDMYNARGIYSVPMAEFALGGVLSLYKQSRFFYENQKKHIWEKHRGLAELAGKTVAVVGCGSVGTACAKRFSAFDCRVLGVDGQSIDNPFFDKIYPPERLHDVLSAADITVLTLPLSKQTRHLFSEKEMQAMKPGSVLVNIARGAVVDTKALIPALHGHLGGAVLDVFEEEPLGEDSPLWDMNHVILSPHNSFIGDGNDRRMTAAILKNLSRYEANG